MKQNEEFKKELRSCDITFWCCIIMYLLVHAISIGIFSHINVETQTEITQVATNYEANVIFKMIMDLGKISYVIQFIMIPGLLYATYFVFRRRVIDGKMDVELLTYFLNFAVMSLFVNLINDGSVLLGKLL